MSLENNEFQIPFNLSRRGKKEEINFKSIGRRIGSATASRLVDRPNIGGKRRRGARGLGMPDGDLNPRTRIDVDGDGTIFDNIPGWEQPDPTPPRNSTPSLASGAEKREKPSFPRKPTYGPFIDDAVKKFGEAKTWEEFKEIYENTEITYIDYETTGLVFDEFSESSGNGSPTQLGAVKMKGGKVVARFETYINPGIPTEQWEKWSRDTLVDYDGKPITNDFIQRQISIAEAHKKLAEFIGPNAILGVQNAAFDKDVLEDNLVASGIDWRPDGWIDLKDVAEMSLPRWSEDNQDGPKKFNKKENKFVPSNSLKDITEYLEVELGDKHHTADADAEATAKSMAALIDRAIDSDWPTNLFDARQREAKLKKETDNYDSGIKTFRSEKEKYIEELKAEQDASLSSGAKKRPIIKVTPPVIKAQANRKRPIIVFNKDEKKLLSQHRAVNYKYGDESVLGGAVRATKNNWLKGMTSQQIAELMVPKSRDQHFMMWVDDLAPGAYDNPATRAAFKKYYDEILTNSPWDEVDYSEANIRASQDAIALLLDSSPQMKWAVENHGTPFVGVMSTKAVSNYEAIPEVANKLDMLQRSRGVEKRPYVRARLVPGTNMLIFNKRMLIDRESSLSNEKIPFMWSDTHMPLASDSHIDNSVVSTIPHEWGHWLVFRALKDLENRVGSKKDNKSNFFGSGDTEDDNYLKALLTAEKYTDTEMNPKLMSLWDAGTPIEDTKDTSRVLTSYGHVNPAETFAEGVVAYFHPNPEVRKNAINQTLRDDIEAIIGNGDGKKPWDENKDFEIALSSGRTSSQRSARRETNLNASEQVFSSTSEDDRELARLDYSLSLSSGAIVPESGSRKLGIINDFDDRNNDGFATPIRNVRFRDSNGEDVEYTIFATGKLGDAVYVFEKSKLDKYVSDKEKSISLANGVPFEDVGVSVISRMTEEREIRNKKNGLVGMMSIFPPTENMVVGKLRMSGNKNGTSIIAEIAIDKKHQRRGLASALFKYHRDFWPDQDLHHSSTLSDDGKAFAAATPFDDNNISLSSRAGHKTKLNVERYGKNGEYSEVSSFEINGETFNVSRGGDSPGRGAYNGYLAAFDNGENIAHIDYQLDTNDFKAVVAMVFTKEEYRRSGIAEALLDSLMLENPNYELSPGYTTEDGAKWWRSVTGGDGPIKASLNKNRSDSPSLSSGAFDYRGLHGAPGRGSGAPLHDLVSPDYSVYPEDVYSSNAIKYYGVGDDNFDAAAFDLIRRFKGKPNAEVTIYRAAPVSKAKRIEKLEKQIARYMSRGKRPAGFDRNIEPHVWSQNTRDEIERLKKLPPEDLSIRQGDWVTPIRSYAVSHGDGALRGDYEIVKKRVKAKHVYTAGDSWLEWGYDDSKGSLSISSGAQPKINLTDEEKREIISIASQRTDSFSKSVVAQFRQNGYLSEKQWTALNRMTLRRNRSGPSLSSGALNRKPTKKNIAEGKKVLERLKNDSDFSENGESFENMYARGAVISSEKIVNAENRNIARDIVLDAERKMNIWKGEEEEASRTGDLGYVYEAEGMRDGATQTFRAMYGDLTTITESRRENRRNNRSSGPSLSSGSVGIEEFKNMSNEEHARILSEAGLSQRYEAEAAGQAIWNEGFPGLYQVTLEHAGDLYHRSQHRLTDGAYGLDELDEKLTKLLRWLEAKYGFRRDVEEQTEQQIRNVDPSLSRDLLVSLGKKYADAHSKLPVYTLPTELMVKASMHLGNWEFEDAAKTLKELKEMLKDKKKWRFMLSRQGTIQYLESKKLNGTPSLMSEVLDSKSTENFTSTKAIEKLEQANKILDRIAPDGDILQKVLGLRESESQKLSVGSNLPLTDKEVEFIGDVVSVGTLINEAIEQEVINLGGSDGDAVAKLQAEFSLLNENMLLYGPTVLKLQKDINKFKAKKSIAVQAAIHGVPEDSKGLDSLSGSRSHNLYPQLNVDELLSIIEKYQGSGVDNYVLGLSETVPERVHTIWQDQPVEWVSPDEVNAHLKKFGKTKEIAENEQPSPSSHTPRIILRTNKNESVESDQEKLEIVKKNLPLVRDVQQLLRNVSKALNQKQNGTESTPLDTAISQGYRFSDKEILDMLTRTSFYGELESLIPNYDEHEDKLGYIRDIDYIGDKNGDNLTWENLKTSVETYGLKPNDEIWIKSVTSDDIVISERQRHPPHKFRMSFNPITEEYSIELIEAIVHGTNIKSGDKIIDVNLAESYLRETILRHVQSLRLSKEQKQELFIQKFREVVESKKVAKVVEAADTVSITELNIGGEIYPAGTKYSVLEDAASRANQLRSRLQDELKNTITTPTENFKGEVIKKALQAVGVEFTGPKDVPIIIAQLKPTQKKQDFYSFLRLAVRQLRDEPKALLAYLKRMKSDTGSHEYNGEDGPEILARLEEITSMIPKALTDGSLSGNLGDTQYDTRTGDKQTHYSLAQTVGAPLKLIYRVVPRMRRAHATHFGDGLTVITQERPADETKVRWMSTALHETFHGVENANPVIKVLEWMFWRSRKKPGEDVVKLRDMPKGKGVGYGKDEIGVIDNWGNLYAGKVYNNYTGTTTGGPLENFEILTTGVQGIFYPETGASTLGDREHMGFTMGILALVRKTTSNKSSPTPNAAITSDDGLIRQDDIAEAGREAAESLSGKDTNRRRRRQKS